jgi:hypothetical protein
MFAVRNPCGVLALLLPLDCKFVDNFENDTENARILDRFLAKGRNINWHENPSRGSRILCGKDGGTDGEAESSSRFSRLICERN